MSLYRLAALSFLTLIVLLAGCSVQEEARPLQILFLGHDRELHDSASYLPILAGQVSQKGIHFTYTSSLEDLNTEYLDHFDGLMIYANHEHIEPDQESALLDFVADGKGLIAVHSASYCFLNSDAYISLVGGQFDSHGSGEFTADIIAPDHPAIKGVSEFETWDETYVHRRHNEDRTVIMRREGEPYTWVRNHGKGRVFYTAYGHDDRTWMQPEFLHLLEQGIVWAVGMEASQSWEKLKLPRFDYSISENIPNYEQRDPWPQLQAPFTPEQSMSLIQVPPEFNLELYASEPDIVNPIYMNWDHKGRLWVIESVDYPNEVAPDQRGNDRIKIVEDTNADGKADQFTIFADGLNIPTSLTFVDDGVLVSAAPHFLFLKDTTGNDRADVREVVMEGWGTRDTHAGPSNLRYGFDNKIWGAIGYSGYREPGSEEDDTVGSANWRNRPDDGTLAFGNGLFRMNPDGSELTFISQFTNNTWGMGFSETFDIFGSTANNTHSIYVGIPIPYLEGIEEIENRRSQEKIDGHYAVRPLTPNVRQVDVHGGFTAASGHALYTARSYPEEYWNRIAFVSEPTAHLLHRARIEKQGAGFREVDGWNMMASPDEWMSPIQAEVGPDGAVWVSDWYNFIIQHNPTPRPDHGGYQAETGEGNAHVNPLRDRDRGRIYRIVYKEAEDQEPLSLSKDDPNGLLKALGHENMFWRLTAQRLLIERGETDVAGKLREKVDDQRLDVTGLNAGALHALWSLHGLGELTGRGKSLEVAIEALNHPSAGVRKAAAQVLPPIPASSRAILEAGSLQDPDPHTQLAVILKISELPPLEGIIRELEDLEQDEAIHQDRWLKDAVFIALQRQRQKLSQMGETLQETGPVEQADQMVDGVRRITISIPEGLMKFDTEEFVVRTGEKVTIQLVNPDHMPHNLLILKPGTLQQVGEAADRLARQTDAVEKHYVPETDDVLLHTPLLDMGQSYELSFNAPKEPGFYPYVCTFPGHWRTMQGRMKVVANSPSATL